MKSEFTTKPLSALADIQTGPFGSQLHKEDYVQNGTPIVTVEHLGQKRFTEKICHAFLRLIKNALTNIFCEREMWSLAVLAR